MSSPDVSLIIPAYNEAARLPDTLRTVLAYLDAQALSAELIVVDDGSQDATPQLIQDAAQRDPRVVASLSPHNRGKGAAIARGVAQARGRYVIFFDADLSYDLSLIEVAIDALEGGAEVVIGARDLGEVDAREAYGAGRRAATRVFNGLVEAALGLGVPDTQCGFKAFRLEVARALFAVLQVERFGFDVELLSLVRRWSLRLTRIPAVMRDREGSSVRLGRDSAQMMLDIWRIRRRHRRGDYPPRPASL